MIKTCPKTLMGVEKINFVKKTPLKTPKPTLSGGYDICNMKT